MQGFTTRSYSAPLLGQLPNTNIDLTLVVSFCCVNCFGFCYVSSRIRPITTQFTHLQGGGWL